MYKETPIVFKDITSKITIAIAENRGRTKRKGKAKKKASNSSEKEIGTSSDSKPDLEIANETVNSFAFPSFSRNNK